MSNSVLDHFKRTQESDKKRQEFTSGNIWHSWQSEQVVRFIGDFMQNKVHWINNGSPNSSLKSKIQLYDDKLFEKGGKLPLHINCANWDVATDQRKQGGCVICRLNAIARKILKENAKELSKEELDEFTELKRKTDDRTTYRWNSIIRGLPDKVYKIVSLGRELFTEVMNIHNSYQPKIFCSVDEGVDIKIGKIQHGGKTSYTANIMIVGGQSLAITPLTEEEKAWKMHNLKDICCKLPDNNEIQNLLLPKWLDLIKSDDEFKKSGAEINPGKAETPAAGKADAPF